MDSTSDKDEFTGYPRSVQYYNYKSHSDSRNKFDFMSRIFSTKKKQKKMKVRSPQMRRIRQIKTLSPERKSELLYVVNEDDVPYQVDETEDSEFSSILHPQYNVMLVEPTPRADHTTQTEKYLQNTREYHTETCKKDKVIGEIRKNKTYFEVVKVEDRGTDPWECVVSSPVARKDIGTDAMLPAECQLSSCEKERESLRNRLNENDKIMKCSLDEGSLLLGDIERIRKHFANSGSTSDLMGKHLNHKQETPCDFLRLGRACLLDLWKLSMTAQRQMEADMTHIKSELSAISKEKSENESKIKSLEHKVEAQTDKAKQEKQGASIEKDLKIGKLEASLEMGKKQLREIEKSLKMKIEKLELELTAQKQSNIHLGHNLDEKSLLVNQLETNLNKLQNSLEISKQQLKDMHCSYKSKITKLELEYTNKMAALCENQTSTNKQMSQALQQSSNYVSQLQETKKENTMLRAENKVIHDKIAAMECDLSKAQERYSLAERKLTRENQEVLTLRSELDRLEALRNEEMMIVDIDTWCKIMYQQDQLILEDLRASLEEKETFLESLRAQGDCALKDFEKAEHEFQQRQQQFNELKCVFLDFEKKRDSVVREQRDLYNKMMFLSRKSIPRDTFVKNLIEECQSKSYRIEELEQSVNSTDTIIEETKRISEAQLKAMQMEMKFTAEKLYEFENQIRVKEMQLQEIIRVLEQEKKNKITSEEAMNTYKILLEDSKKENAEIRCKLNYLEDLEKNRTNVLRATEELARETQKRHDTEVKLKKLESDFLEMKTKIHSKGGDTNFEADTLIDNSNEVEKLKTKIKDLTENKKYMERILKESHRSKEALQKYHEELCNKMRHAVHVMVESKEAQETMEVKLEQRLNTIQLLQKSQAETEDRLDDLKDVLHGMKKTIEKLHLEKEELRDKMSNHIHCSAERAIHQELKLFKREAAMNEEQHSREKELLVHRLREKEDTINEQHKHLHAFQEQLDNLNSQLREAKGQLAAERHNLTQQLLTLQADKKKLELYIKELERRLMYGTRLRMQTPETTTTPMKFNSSDSYEPPMRDQTKHQYHRK